MELEEQCFFFLLLYEHKAKNVMKKPWNVAKIGAKSLVDTEALKAQTL